MLINKIKNFIIIFFVLLAVYQTGTLWFENFSSRSFFYSFMPGENGTGYDDTRYTISNIMIGSGSGEFIKRSNGIYESEYKSIFDTAIKECIEKGKYNGEIEESIGKMLKGSCIIYNYDYISDGKDITKIFGKELSVLKKIGSFDCIIINPDKSVPENMKVTFFDSAENKGFEFEIKNNPIIGECCNTANNIEKRENETTYISSTENGLELFAKNIFIPKKQNGSGFSGIKASNIFEEDGSVLLMTLEKNINNFFDNPATKWSSTVNDVYTYSDENTVVKYYTNGVLEYSSYKNAGRKTKNNFYDNYMTAVEFMEKDINIKNEYSLDSYKTENDKITFYFNYKINDLPIIMSDELKKASGMKAMIEVTVSGSNVSKYKRLVYVFEENEGNPHFSDFNFLGAIDSVINDIDENESNKIDDIELCYEINENMDTGLSYLIEINGRDYLKSAE